MPVDVEGLRLPRYLSLHDAVRRTVCEAAVCWEKVGAAGRFDARRADAVIDALLTYLRCCDETTAGRPGRSPLAAEQRPVATVVKTRIPFLWNVHVDGWDTVWRAVGGQARAARKARRVLSRIMTPTARCTFTVTL